MINNKKELMEFNDLMVTLINKIMTAHEKIGFLEKALDGLADELSEVKKRIGEK